MTVVSHNGNTAPKSGEGRDARELAAIIGALMGQKEVIAKIIGGDIKLNITADSVNIVSADSNHSSVPSLQITPHTPEHSDAAALQQTALADTPPVVHKKPPEAPAVQHAPTPPPVEAHEQTAPPETVVTNRHENQSVPVSETAASAPPHVVSAPEPVQAPAPEIIMPPAESEQPDASASTMPTPLSDLATSEIHDVSDTPPPRSPKPRNAGRGAKPEPVTAKPDGVSGRNRPPRGSATDYMPSTLINKDGAAARTTQERNMEIVRKFAMGGLAASAIVAGGASAGISGPDHAEAAGGIQDVGHTLVITGDGSGEGIVGRLKAAVNRLGFSDGRDLADAAAKISEERGYLVTARDLAEANPTIKDAQTGKEHKLEVSPDDRNVDNKRLPAGHLEIKVPAPVPKGQAYTEQGDTVESIAKELGVSVAKVRELNPDLPEKDTVLVPEGKRIQYEERPDTSMVLQVATERTSEEVNVLLSIDDETRKKLIAANPGLLDDGLQPGERVYIPLKETPEMAKAGITPAEVIEENKPAYTNPQGTNAPAAEKPAAQAPDKAAAPTTAKPQAKAPDQPATKVPEKLSPASKLAAEQAAAQQDKIIDGLELSAERKATLKMLVHGLSAIQTDAEAKGINMSVMTAQGILETGWGDSTLASKYNNWFGNKANDGWKGKSVTVGTSEHVNGSDIRIRDAFRVYDTVAEGFQDYITKATGKTFYEDARRYPTDARMYVRGLVNDMNKDGVITGKQGNKGVKSYATDPNYEDKIMSIVNKLQLPKLFDLSRTQDVKSAAYTVPGKKTSASKIIKGPGKQLDVILPGTAGPLDPEDYSDVQDYLPKPGSKNKGAYIDADDNPATGKGGKEKLASKVGERERLNIITRELSQVTTSKEGFEKFKAEQFKDIRDRVKADFPYFNGDVNGLGKPRKSSDIKGLVIHFTATKSSINGMDGYRLASSMHNNPVHGQKIGKLGVQLFMNDEGTAYKLTDDFTNHARNFDGVRYNGKWYGIEIAASEQAELNSTQYTALTYVIADFLISHNFVQPGESIDAAMTTMIKGHREANASNKLHGDFPGIVMDRVRGEAIDFMVEDLGYKSNMYDKAKGK